MPGKIAKIRVNVIKKGYSCYNKCKCGGLKHWRSRRCRKCYAEGSRRQLSRIETLINDRRRK